MTSVCVNSVVDNSFVDDSVWNEEDENRIAEYFNNLEFEIEQKLFLIELELANMQPNTAYGLWVVDQEIKYKSAVIIEDCREEGYCIAKFPDDNDTIYVPALDGTYNSYLREGMEVMRHIRDTNWTRWAGKRDECWLKIDPLSDDGG